MIDYTQIAMESLLQESGTWKNLKVSQMLAESEFILNSLEEGYIVDFVQEGVLSDTAKKALDALVLFLEKIISKFKSKCAEYNEKYIPWVEKNEDRFKEKAKDGSLTLAPYWKAEYSKDSAVMKTLAQTAFKHPFSPNDVSFATNILPSIKTPEDLNDTTALLTALKNKFRFNLDENDNSKIKKETLSGSDLESRVGDMITYIKEYKKLMSTVDTIKSTWKNNATKFKEAVGESVDVLSSDMFLTIEQTTIGLSDLRLLEGFDAINSALMEADGDNKLEPITKVENNNAGKDNDNDNGDNKPPTGGTDRYRMVDKFCRLAFTSFLTAAEERFIVYIKCLSQVLGESPQIDK